MLRFRKEGGEALRPGSYVPRLSATDLAGNAGSVDLPAVQVEWDTRAPVVDASVTRRTLAWEADDPGTPWLDLRVLLSSGTRRRRVELGRRPLAGRAALRLPPGTWRAVLTATNSARKTARVDLGVLSGAP